MSMGEYPLNPEQELIEEVQATADPRERIKRALEIGVRAAGASGGTVYLHDPEAHQLYFYYSVGARTPDAHPEPLIALAGEPRDDTKGIAGKVFQTATTQIDNDPASSPDFDPDVGEELQIETLNMVTVPLSHPGETPFGVLQVLNKHSGEFTPGDAKMLDALAQLLAAALRADPATA